MVDKTFLEVVGIKGLHTACIILWALGIVVMFGLTINDLYPVLRNYYDENANMAVQINVERNTTTKVPQLYFAMPLPVRGGYLKLLAAGLMNKTKNATASKCEWCDWLHGHSWDVWHRLPPETFNDQGALIPAMVQKMLSNLSDDDLTHDVFNFNNTGWNKPIKDALWWFFGHEVHGHDANFTSRLATTTLTRKPHITERRQEKLDFLMKQFVTSICQLITMFDIVNSENVYWNTSKCAESIVRTAAITTWPGERVYLSFLLPLSGSDFGLFLSAAFFDYVTQRQDFYVSAEDPAFTEANTALYQSPFRELAANDSRKEAITIKYTVQTNVIEERNTSIPCYRGPSKSACIFDCKTKAVIQHCKCVPFTSRSLPAAKSVNYSVYCGVADYRKCSEDYAKGSSAENCQDRCGKACEFTSFQWQIDKQIENDQNPSFYLSIIKPFDQPYLQFNISVRDTPSQMISQVGGILNFYLGLSGLSIIIFCIYLIDCYQRWMETKKGKQQETAETPSPFGWQWSWLKLTTSVALSQARAAPDLKSLQEEMLTLKKRMEEIEQLIQQHGVPTGNLKNEAEEQKQ